MGGIQTMQDDSLLINPMIGTNQWDKWERTPRAPAWKGMVTQKTRVKHRPCHVNLDTGLFKIKEKDRMSGQVRCSFEV